MSETTAYLPVISAAMKLMVACQRNQSWPLPIAVGDALREMEDVVRRVEAKGQCSCKDTSGTVLQSMAIVGNRTICMICHEPVVGVVPIIPTF